MIPTIRSRSDGHKIFILLNKFLFYSIINFIIIIFFLFTTLAVRKNIMVVCSYNLYILKTLI